MSQSDLSAKAKYVYGLKSGAILQKSEAVSQPAYLMDGAIKLFPEIKGSTAYKKRLEDTAKDLYRQITTAPSVLSHIKSGKSVLGDQKTRGILKRFQLKHEHDNRQALTWLLHSMAFVASMPTVIDNE